MYALGIYWGGRAGKGVLVAARDCRGLEYIGVMEMVGELLEGESCKGGCQTGRECRACEIV